MGIIEDHVAFKLENPEIQTRSICPRGYYRKIPFQFAFIVLVCGMSKLGFYQTTVKLDIEKENSNVEAEIKNRLEAAAGEVIDVAHEETNLKAVEEEESQVETEDEVEQMAEEEDWLRVKADEESRLKASEAKAAAEEMRSPLKAEEEANAAATEKTKQMTAEEARSKVNETIAATEEEELQLKVKEESGVDAAMKTCELRNLSSYNIGRQYRDKLKSSLTDNNCIRFECIHNSIEDCGNALPTNYDGSDPPCCTHVLRDMARKFDETMCTLGLDYMASFGTLLGFVRSDQIIPWTADNDYTISESTANAMVDLWDANETGLAYLFQNMTRMCVTDTFAEGKLLKWKIALASQKLVDKRMHIPYIDLYIGRNLTDNRFGEYPHCDHKYSDVWPTQRVQVYNKTFNQNIPAYPKHVLRKVYGKYWSIPDEGKSIHGGSTACKPLVP